ncbi:TPA: sulfite dehydrogenase [Pseudomonas aeruginosa]|nr:sulfite dehydrogenase [Pseudomonas aeruginosa]HCA5868832.1 sulfite dehydrogenase [Pseudomonas aeruginosa]HCA7379609.1 sulfite dehydrogenase [Pseudomonas aeruginosa]HCA7777470.1 sulfite dehydrogenase [Pseudomonas aeruginosa]
MLSRLPWPGRLRPAPENFLSHDDVQAVRAGRRDFLQKSLLTASAAMLAPLAARATEDDPAIVQLPSWSTSVGQPVAASPYGQPSKHEAALQRRALPGLSKNNANSQSFTPLQGLFGIITPSGLHYERHHQGWYDLDPRQHRLMITAAKPEFMREPMVFSLDDLMRLPAVSRIHFLECGGNTGIEWGNPMVPTVQYTHGLLSCSEFTGVPLRLLLEHCGVDFKQVRYVLAEGADGASLTRTIPMELIESGEVLVAYGQNGEMLRPENGYPLRLIVPGVQGVSWVKWLRRIEVGEQPYATREEAVHYVDLMADGKLRQYSSLQECKSVITSPSGGQKLLGHGFFCISGLAWSGRGKIRQVEVSVDGGKNWRLARMEGLVLDKALTRFNFDWEWNGQAAILQSRATDEAGHIQPGYRQLREERGQQPIYHNNAIQSWEVLPSGEVNNVQVG